MSRAGQRSLFDSLVVDCFAGGGGASVGLEDALGRTVDIAINHDPEAVAMHEANHPHTRHFCESIFDVDPIDATAGRPVGVAWFSPDCTHHSRAKGGKPRSQKRRSLAWIVIRWAAKVRPRVIFLENVEEFATWGPLVNGHPCPKRRGKTFRAWVAQLRRLGYAVEWRTLAACDFGAPTTRKRLYLIARRDGLPIVWPEPTHGPGRPKPWRTAAECIAWEIPCPSIFERPRPLADATLRRIAAGIHRYVLDTPRPFIVPMTHHGGDRTHDLAEPMRTVTAAHRGELALAAPVLTKFQQNSIGQSPAAPLHTVLAGAPRFGVVAPTLIQAGYGEREGQAPRTLDLQKPLGTVVAGGLKHALVAAFLARHFGGVVGSRLDESMRTVTAIDHHSLVEASLAGGVVDRRTEVRAFLAAYYGQGVGQDVADPMRTATTRDRFALVEVEGREYEIADIGLRMLIPRELFRAQGFPERYRIDPIVRGKPLTKTAQTRMVGNSVCPPVAAAIVRANVGAERVEVAA